MSQSHKRKKEEKEGSDNNNQNTKQEIICNRFIKKLKKDLFNNDISLVPFYKMLQNKLQQEIYNENYEKNRKLTITKLPFEILLNILQFFEIYDSLNYYLICKDWFYTIYTNEHFWTLQFTNFWTRFNSYKNSTKNSKNKTYNFTIDNFTNNIYNDWKYKRKYLLLKNNLTLQQLQLKQKKAIYNNIYLNHENHEYKIEQNPSFLEINPKKLFFTKNILFTKFNVNLQRVIEDDGGSSESKGQLKGYYFLNNYPSYLKFNFKFNTNYDVNAWKENIIWDYQLTFTKKEEKVTKINVLKKSHIKGQDVAFYLTKDVLEKLNEWLDLKDETKVYHWLVDIFFKKELSFLGFGKGYDLLEFLSDDYGYFEKLEEEKEEEKDEEDEKDEENKKPGLEQEY
ncbi:hypothetical protein ABK040_012081 [Willaertia magna]